MYIGNMFRPPVEAYSLLVQVTVGCSHNDCKFCFMYKGEDFRVRSLDEIHEHIKVLRKNTIRPVKRVFLCDGNALVMKNSDLKQIIEWIKNYFPECEEITSYAQASDILRKSDEELKELKNLGLKTVYIGLESGSDEVLKMMNKNVDSKDMIEAANKLHKADILLSTFAILGLGGKELAEEHIKGTYEVVNEMDPDFFGLLTLMMSEESQLYQSIQDGSFKEISPKQSVEEIYEVLKGLEVEGCTFTSRHASNYLYLKGDLPEDKSRLLEEIETYLEETDFDNLRVGRGF